MRDYSLLIAGSSGVDGDGTGGRSPSRHGAGTGPSEPPKLVGDGGGALYRIWENPSRVRVFSSGVIYRPKGVERGSPRGTGERRPWPHSHPRVGPAPRLWVPPGVALLAPVLISTIKNHRKFSPNSENISRSKFLKQKQDKNRELALGILSIG